MFPIGFCRKRSRSSTLGLSLSLVVATAALWQRPAAAQIESQSVAQAAPDDSLPAASQALAQAWQEFQAGQFKQALRHYQLAHRLHEPSGDAELGLAWTLQRLERCDEARPHFTAVLALRPGDAGAQLGLKLCPPPRPFAPSAELGQGLYVYQFNPSRNLASATTVRLSAWLRARWLVAATYRFTYISPRQPTDGDWLQHEAYATAAYAQRRYGFSLHYGMLHGALNQATDYAQTSHHFGFSARYSPYGDGLFAFAASLFPGDPTLRGELSWRLPIDRGFSVKPRFALQWSATGWMPNGALTLAYDSSRVGLFIGGKLGAERHPALLTYDIIYNNPERIDFGVWAGAWARPGAGFSLNFSYALDHLLTDATSTTSTTGVAASAAHYLTLSLSKEF